jgi:AcrR family transcriptional regulator
VQNVKRGKTASIFGDTDQAEPARERILAAAFAAFTARGFAAASTLDIATRARVSKRELYALFGSKQQMLVACIAERARRMRLPADSAAPRNRPELEARLAQFGALMLRELSEPEVVAVYRLAISEADRSPEVGRALDRYGSRAACAALREILEGAQSAGLLTDNADLAELVSRFMSLLLDDLLMSMVLGLRSRPDKQEIEQRSSAAARTVLELGGTSSGATRRAS